MTGVIDNWASAVREAYRFQQEQEAQQEAARKEADAERLASAVSAILGYKFAPNGNRLTLTHGEVTMTFVQMYGANAGVGVAHNCPVCDAELRTPVKTAADVGKILAEGFPSHIDCPSASTIDT